MHPILVEIGRLELPAYGTLLVIGVALALLTARLRADRSGMDGARVVDFGLWLVIWALLGAKVLLVVVELPRYISDPAELISVVRAGGVFLGGFIAAIIAAAVLLRRYELPALATLDVLAPSLALGHAIGRLGCLMAGCCWGARCDLPWAITYTNPIAAERLGTPLHIGLHPFPVYAALFNFALFLLLAGIHRKRPKPGRVFATYLVVYGIGRFLLEWTRGDTARGFVLGGALSTSQSISLVLVLVGVAVHVWVSRRAAK